MEGMLIMSTHCRIIERRWILIYQFRLGTTWLENLYFPFPPINEQQRIVQKIEELFSVLDNIQNALEV